MCINNFDGKIIVVTRGLVKFIIYKSIQYART